jgi:hypothetical protein
MRFLSVFVLLLLLACGSEPPVSRFEKIAKAYCECTAHLATMNEKAAAMAADTNAVAGFQENLRQIQEEYSKAKNCTATIVAQFGKLKPAELDSVMTALAGKCANTAEQADLLQEMLGE